jgi:hypothetical protein
VKALCRVLLPVAPIVRWTATSFTPPPARGGGGGGRGGGGGGGGGSGGGGGGLLGRMKASWRDSTWGKRLRGGRKAKKKTAVGADGAAGAGSGGAGGVGRAGGVGDDGPLLCVSSETRQLAMRATSADDSDTNGTTPD